MEAGRGIARRPQTPRQAETCCPTVRKTPSGARCQTRNDPMTRPRRATATCSAPGPKRILALDGGGVRGVIAVAFLERSRPSLERQQRRRPPRRYFDLIGGTSTGAIIGGALALGKTTDGLRDIYHRPRATAFKRSRFRIPLSPAEVQRVRPCAARSPGIIGDRTLDTPDLRTGYALWQNAWIRAAPGSWRTIRARPIGRAHATRTISAIATIRFRQSRARQHGRADLFRAGTDPITDDDDRPLCRRRRVPAQQSIAHPIHDVAPRALWALLGHRDSAS